ncbi:hypothetical protein [Streptomyces sp. NPDC015131]|uniref:CIS tube protein n=1 Tax=Streptomyces sp. NPDC015131 TaxID=3364941 RepID=UPI0036F91D08
MSTPATGTSLQRAVRKAVLRDPAGRKVTFAFNPVQISLSHNAEGLSDPVGQDDGRNDQSLVSSIATRGSTRLILSTLTFVGDGIQNDVALLLGWVTEETVTRPDGTTEKGKRQRLGFQWGTKGSGLDYEVELMRFDCTYTRFARDGRPIRAEVRNLTLHVLSHTGPTPASAGTGSTAPAVPGGGPAGLPAGAGADPNADPTRTLLGRGAR